MRNLLVMSFNTIRFMSIISFNTSLYSLDGVWNVCCWTTICPC